MSEERQPERRYCTEVRPELVDYGPGHGGLRVDLVGEGVAGTLASLSVPEADRLAGALMRELRRAYRTDEGGSR